MHKVYVHFYSGAQGIFLVSTVYDSVVFSKLFYNGQHSLVLQLTLLHEC